MNSKKNPSLCEIGPTCPVAVKSISLVHNAQASPTLKSRDLNPLVRRVSHHRPLYKGGWAKFRSQAWLIRALIPKPGKR
jgi:hypothetical protein